MTLQIKPELASWERAGHPSQVRLSRFLDHVATLAEPVGAGVDGPLAIEMVVGLPENVTLIAGGRDLDNFLCPVAQRIGAGRLAAVFGRKVHAARSSLAVGPAVPQAGAPVPQFTTHRSGHTNTRHGKRSCGIDCWRRISFRLTPARYGCR